MWVGIGLFRLLSKLPWKVQVALGSAMGRFAFLLLPERRHVVKVNLDLCFPEASENEKRALASKHYAAIGIGLFEACVAWWAASSRLPQYRITGREHLEAAMAQGKGVILFTAHFTTLEICGRLLAENFPLGGLYRDPDNPVVAREMHRRRVAKMSAAVPMNDLRGLIRALRKNHVMWYAPDQSKRGKLFEIIPFFGVPAQTNTATSRIATMSGSAVVPYFGFRLPDGSYELQILPPLEDFPTDDATVDSLRTNKLIEDFVRQAPEQYFWVHRRFKKRGEGYEDVYRQR